MSKRFYIMIAMIAASVFVLYCCGGGGDGDEAELTTEGEEEVLSTLPKIASLKDAAGNLIEFMGSTNVFPSSFTLTFDRAMDEESVTAEGNIVFTCTCVDDICEDLPFNLSFDPTFTVESNDEEGKEYIITVEAAYKYQRMECTLTISQNVTAPATSTIASKALELGEDISFTFTNSCAVSDDFNTESHDCWTAATYVVWAPAYPTSWDTWADLLYIFQPLRFVPYLSSLVYDDSRYDGGDSAKTEDRTFGIYKNVDLEGPVLEATIHFGEVSDITAIDDEPPVVDPDIKDHALVYLGSTELGLGYGIGIASHTEKRDVLEDMEKRQYCIALSVNINTFEVVIYGTRCDYGDQYVRLRYTGDSVTFERSTDGLLWVSDFVQIFPDPSVPTSLTVFEDLSGDGVIGFMFQATPTFNDSERPPGYWDEPQNNRAVIDSLVVDGATGFGQY